MDSGKYLTMSKQFSTTFRRKTAQEQDSDINRVGLIKSSTSRQDVKLKSVSIT